MFNYKCRFPVEQARKGKRQNTGGFVIDYTRFCGHKLTIFAEFPTKTACSWEQK
jgi:hypothetical protein